jgi:type I restriction enzyme S subunit
LWVTESKYSDLEAYSVDDGDVIISRAGTVGKMGVVRTKSEHSIISTNLIRVRFGEKLRPEYFVNLMNYCKGRIGRLKTGPDGAFTHMNTGILDKLEFPYPAIELQDRFIDIKKKVISSLEKGEAKEIDNLFNSLSQKAFAGEL